MFDQLSEQLKSSEATQRRQAIVGLGKLADQRALPLLANIFRSDPDPALRELAKKAGQHIKKQSTTSTAAGAASPSTPPSQPAATPVAPPKPKPTVSTPAFTIDPLSLSDDQFNAPMADPLTASNDTYTPAPFSYSSYSSSLVAGPFANQEESEPEITFGDPTPPVGYPPASEEAAASVFGFTPYHEESAPPPSASYTPSSESRLAPISPIAPIAPIAPLPMMPSVAPQAMDKAAKPKKSSSSTVSNEVLTLFAMLIALFIVQTFLGVASRYAIQPLLSQFTQIQNAAFTTAPRNSRSSSQALRSQQQLALAQQQLSRISVGEVMAEGFVSTFMTLIELAILFGVGTAMGGSGAALPFLSNLLFIQIIIQILSVVGAGLMLFGVTRIPSELLISNTPSSAALSAASSALTLIYVGLGILALVFIGGSIWKVYAVAKNHEVGFLKGFLIVLVAGVVMGCVNSMLSAAMFSSSMTLPG